jgi:hypothetical protein
MFSSRIDVDNYKVFVTNHVQFRMAIPKIICDCGEMHFHGVGVEAVTALYLGTNVAVKVKQSVVKWRRLQLLTALSAHERGSKAWLETERQCPVAGSCGHGNEPWPSVEDGPQE